MEETKEDLSKEPPKVQKQLTPLDEAIKVNADLTRTLDSYRELVERHELVAAQNALMGRANAGESAVKQAEQTPEEYARALRDGKIKLI